MKMEQRKSIILSFSHYLASLHVWWGLSPLPKWHLCTEFFFQLNLVHTTYLPPQHQPKRKNDMRMNTRSRVRRVFGVKKMGETYILSLCWKVRYQNLPSVHILPLEYLTLKHNLKGFTLKYPLSIL